ncbi:MAG: sortase [Lachnospiraceae bacterium]|nr:sortase [Lachnospiraceae bacterium]
MREWKRRLGMLLFAVCLGGYFTLPVSAAEEIDIAQNGTGTLTVLFETSDEEMGIQDAEFTIYRVEELVEVNGVQQLEWNPEFEDCGISLENLTASQMNQAAIDLNDYVEGSRIIGVAQSTDESGSAAFTHLTFGTYLVALSDIPEDYLTIDPFLISVPMKDVDGKILYDVVTMPKTERLPQGGLVTSPTPLPTPETTVAPMPEEPAEPTLAPVLPTPGPVGPKLPQTGQARWLVPVLLGFSLLVFVAGWMMLRRKAGKYLMGSGVMLFVVMLVVAGYQNYTEQASENAVEDMRIVYEEAMQRGDMIIRPSEQAVEGKEEAEVNVENKMEVVVDAMPYIQIEDEACIGVISIPAIDISLPVNKDCSVDSLKKMPCRYVGDVQQSFMVIAAHNYDKHFGNISLLAAGDEVKFTDVEGQEYCFEVKEVEILGAYDVEEMVTGDWDLTLFTCTYGGQNRVTVRCCFKESL